MKEAVNLDTGKRLYFDANTAYVAMQKLIYYLNLNGKDENCVINKSDSGTHLWLIHNGETWSIRND